MKENSEHKPYDVLMHEIDITLKTQTDVAIVEYMERGEVVETVINPPPAKQTSKTLMFIVVTITAVYFADLVIGIWHNIFLSAKWLIACGVLGIVMLIVSVHRWCISFREDMFLQIMLCLWKILFIVYGIILLTKHIEKFELRYMLFASVALEMLEIVTYLFVRCRENVFSVNDGADVVYVDGNTNNAGCNENTCDSCGDIMQVIVQVIGMILKGIFDIIVGFFEIVGGIVGACDCDDD